MTQGDQTLDSIQKYNMMLISVGVGGGFFLLFLVGESKKTQTQTRGLCVG